MSACHARRRRTRRLGLLSALLMVSLVGCGGGATETGKVSSDNPRTGPRRKEMSDFMKNQPPGGSSTR